jgi:hypothetical protein
VTGNESVSLFFSDDGSGFSYMSLSNEFGDDLLYNRIVLTSPAGTEVQEDSSSIFDYGVSGLVWDDLLNSSTSSLETLANKYLDNFSQPVVRFTGVTVQLVGLSFSEQQELLRADLINEIILRKTFSVGDPLMVEQNLVISGIKHSISPGSHIIEFTLEESLFPEFDVFILDSMLFGVLDTNLLA